VAFIDLNHHTHIKSTLGYMVKPT